MHDSLPGSFDPQTRRLALSQRDPAFFTDPYPTYAMLHGHSPAFYWEDIGMWSFIGYDAVNALLRDRRFGRQILHVATREELGLAEPRADLAEFDAVEAHSLLELEGRAHARLRTLVNRAFVSRQIDKLRPYIEALSHGIIDEFGDAGTVELLKTFGETIPVTIIARMIGLPEEDGPLLLDWSHDMVKMYVFGRTAEDEAAANEAAADFAAYVKKAAAIKRAEPGEDLLSHMIHTDRGGDRLSDDEIISTTILLLNAGHEATVHQIGNGVKTVLESGHDPAVLFADAAVTERTVEECLRYDAPLHLFTRWALEDAEVEGISFKKGEQIALMLGAANRDPRKFTDPDAFRPDRDEGVPLSFGAGIHFCIGAPLARLELQVALPILFERLPGLAFAETPTYRDSFHFHGLERLDLTWPV